ncbi:hypothetical protein K469DRAFT_683580 [Zopfia rhizophila CBS 207.26]|uniref:Uncharacterized protein n=1 Tax=Zopfia rhizophila CBS 207.26 TaxID=1314779 RepID=A0A6A6D898_9PEZI|nr:hypothetical protein K469DRAFT_683580 [Zopfia rhizophila CBS 207.26]
MPLANRDPNASGRTSRAFNVSAGSRGLPKGHGPGGKSDLFSAPGIQSMLRSSTEIGDIGVLLYDSSQMPGVPRPRRSDTTSRMSAGTSLSNKSKQTFNHQAWPSASSGARRSLTSSNVPQYISDTLSPTIMNLPDSSPLIPHPRNSRDGRSFSMANTRQLEFRLSSNRSFASLRTHEQIQRPKSPYHYPTRLRRIGHRPTSPAMSDITGTHPRRRHGHSHSRLKIPPDLSVQDDRKYLASQQSRNKSPTFMAVPHSYIPPGPPLLHHHVLVEQARMIHTPIKGSISSGSTNQRTDSEAPSSDAPSPPTPKNITSMEVLISPTDTQVLVDKTEHMMKADVTTGPLYYDYSERLETGPYSEPEPETVRTGFVHRIKTILEERVTVEKPLKQVDVLVVQEVELPGSEVVGIAELPASPVPKRITRDMILAVLEPVSTIEDVEISTLSLDSRESHEAAGKAKKTQDEADRAKEEVPVSYTEKEGNKGKRYSVVSQTTFMTVPDSSTRDFAVPYSIPMTSAIEEDISDLLDGYQHTESKQEVGYQQKESAAKEPTEKKSNHTLKSSDEQSFKSCTDLNEQLYKDTDARSFKTCKDTVTPERAVSMPDSSIASVTLAKSEPKAKRLVSEMPLSSPTGTVRTRASVPPRECSFSKPITRVRAISKLSSLHGSTVPLISSTAESIAQQPPSVPPRGSSSSREAQRTQAVADFLVRLSPTRRFTKAHTSFGEKSVKDEHVVQQDAGEKMPKCDPRQERFDSDKGKSSIDQALESAKSPGKGVTIQEPVSEKASEKATPAARPAKEKPISKDCTPGSAIDTQAELHGHQHQASIPSPVIQGSSSVYSLDVISPKSRTKSSQAAFPDSLGQSGQSRRDNQSTTHLVWHGHKALNPLSSNAVEPRASQNEGQEETTTDLGLPAYRNTLHFLPDLKEESHEDSSINTSASHFRNSNFRFPAAHLRSIRPSVDDSLMFGRSPSVKSARKSSLAQTRGLPSMSFSRVDLLTNLEGAFNMRSSRSLDGVPDNLHELDVDSPVRPASAGVMHEKYRSLFNPFDELQVSENTQPGSTIDLMLLKGPFSPNHLVAEIDKHTIPSVGGLTQRLSEWIPSLKEYWKLGEEGEFVAEEVIMEHALEEINEVGRPATKRSSARLRPMPGSPNLVVIDDGLYEELTSKRNEDSSPIASASVGEQAEGCEGDAVPAKSIVNVDTREKTPLAELEAPSPVMLRTRSLLLGHREVRPSLEPRLSSRRSLRSVVSIPTATTDTRPWNSDENYPWATTISSIDISLPLPTVLRHSPRPGPSRLRIRLSESSESSTSPLQATPVTPTSPKMTMPGSGDPYNHSRCQGRPISFLAWSKRPNQPPALANNPPAPSFDTSGYPMGPVSVRNNDQSHDVGERYPTTSLHSPPGLSGNIETHSRFSLDSSDDERPATGVKQRLKNIRNKLIPSGRSNLVTTTNHSSMQDQAGEQRDFSARRETFNDANGIPAKEYHGKRILERICTLWHKGGDLFRSISGHKKRLQSQFPPNAEGTAYIQPDGRHIVPLKASRDVNGVPLWTSV